VKGMGGKFRLDLNIERDIQLRIGHNMREVSRFESISIIVACAVAIGWMTGVQNFPVLILGPAAAFLKLAPIWYQIYFPIAALTALEIVRASINLVRPDWVRFRAYYGVFVQAAGLVIVYFLIKAGRWVEAANSGASGAVDYARTVEIINQVFLYALVGTAVFSGVMLLIRVVRLVRQPRGHNGSAGVSARAKEGN
jgi:hypothetical protein